MLSVMSMFAMQGIFPGSIYSQFDCLFKKGKLSAFNWFDSAQIYTVRGRNIGFGTVEWVELGH